MNRNVLVADDDPGVLYTVKSILEDEGYNVLTVTSGRGCIEELDRGFNGLILLDVMMPEMNGWETVRAIVSGGHSERNIICMLTAKQIPDPDLDELKQWVVDYVHKPFEQQELVALVKGYLAYLG